MAYRLKRTETVEEGVRRVAREQLEKAIKELQDADIDRHDAVHQVRKRFKKIRGLVRLVRPGLGSTYDELNRWYRNAGKRLSRVRDAESMLESLGCLRKFFQEPLAAKVFQDIERRLKARRQHIADDWLDLDDELEQLSQQLQAARSGVKQWSLDGDAVEAVIGGLEKTYRRGHKAIHVAAENRNDEALHEWRKRTKYHWYHLRLLRNLWKPVLKALIGELKKLSDLLGDDHDLAVFTTRIEKDPDSFGSEQSVELLRGAIFQQRNRYQQSAFRLGRHVFAEKPKALRKRLERYWRVWKD